jgi:hypothetical protein
LLNTWPQIGKIEEDKRHNKNRAYDKKNINLDSKLQMTFVWKKTDWKQTNVKLMKMTQTTAKYPKYNDNILE